MTHTSDLQTVDRNLVALLKQQRLKSKRSLADLAEKIGVASVTLMRIEAGVISPTPALMGRLLDELGCDFSDIWSRASADEGRFSASNEDAAPHAAAAVA